MRRRELDLVAAIVAELEGGRAHRDPVEARHEPLPIGAAPKLAVGNDLEPDLLLHAHRVADCRVLNAPERLIVDRARLVLLESTANRGRAQQTADMIGAERRQLYTRLNQWRCYH